MKKRALSLLLAVLLCLSLMPASALAEDTIGLDTAQHTKAQIAEYIRSLNYDADSLETYDEEPDALTPPFRPGRLSEASRANGLAVVNAVRYVAGLPEVSIDPEYERFAQAAALVNAANNSLSHGPSQPEGMPDALYEDGYFGASRSNLSLGRPNLYSSIIHGWMADASSASNLAEVGHRRWVLDPMMQKTGLGIVPLETHGSYRRTVAAMYVVDWSGERSPEQLVAWPARVMPASFFCTNYPWSLSINSSLDPDAVSVTLKRENDGHVWHFSNAASDGLFNVSEMGYGTGDCIVFRPEEGMENAGAFPADGERYTVTVTGALEKTIQYTVEFFDLEQSEPGGTEPAPTASPTAAPTATPTAPPAATGFRDVDANAFYAPAVEWAVNHDPQVTNGTAPGLFSPKEDCTRAQTVTFLWRAMGCPQPQSRNNPFADVKPGTFCYDAVLWAVEQGITKGTAANAFSPGAKVTRGQTVTFLWRLKEEAKVSADNPFTDVKTGAFYYDAVLWAVKKEITKGVSATAFAPNEPCTRGQIVTFLYRAEG